METYYLREHEFNEKIIFFLSVQWRVLMNQEYFPKPKVFISLRPSLLYTGNRTERYGSSKTNQSTPEACVGLCQNFCDKLLPSSSLEQFASERLKLLKYVGRKFWVTCVVLFLRSGKAHDLGQWEHFFLKATYMLRAEAPKLSHNRASA